MLAEGVLSGGGAPRVLAAVSQHALVAAAASAVVEQGRLPHGRRKLATQHAAVGARTKTELKPKIYRRPNSQITIKSPEAVPVVTRMAAAAAVWFPGGCDLAVRRGQRLNQRRLLLPWTTTSASTCCSTSTPAAQEGNGTKEFNMSCFQRIYCLFTF